MTIRTKEHPFFAVRGHFVPAASAELVGLIPAEKMMGSDSGEGGVLRVCSAEDPHILIGIAGKHNLRGIGSRASQKIRIIVYGK